jgi:hypothetical protein
VISGNSCYLTAYELYMRYWSNRVFPYQSWEQSKSLESLGDDGQIGTSRALEVDLVFFVEPLFLACACQLRGYVPDSLLPLFPTSATIISVRGTDLYCRRPEPGWIGDYQ